MRTNRVQHLIVVVAAVLVAVRVIWPAQYLHGGIIVSYWPQPVSYVRPVARQVVLCDPKDLSTYDLEHCMTSGTVLVEGHPGYYRARGS